MLSQEEWGRYARQMVLPGMGPEGQEKLKSARVLVVGAGGLGCPVLLYLAAAGVGTLGIADGDVVSLSNLHRQVLYGTPDVGQSKAETAARRLREMNPLITVTVYPAHLTSSNALEWLAGYDWVVDCTDNFPARYLINDACVLLGKPFVYGAIHRFEGQVSVFNHPGPDGAPGPTYRCLFPEPPPPDQVPNCAEAGVLGVLPGVVGLFQATEVVKALTGHGKVLGGELLLMDLLETSFRKIRFRRTPRAGQVTGLIDYELFCRGAAPADATANEVKSLTVHELHDKLEAGEAVALLDVREPHEYEVCRLEGATLVPLRHVAARAAAIPRDRPVVVYCHFGGRSEGAVRQLQAEFGFTNLYNLQGGIDAWAREIDEEMARY
jgi:adenylyltransferase/sulfurtransferase